MKRKVFQACVLPLCTSVWMQVLGSTNETSKELDSFHNCYRWVGAGGGGGGGLLLLPTFLQCTDMAITHL